MHRRPGNDPFPPRPPAPAARPKAAEPKPAPPPAEGKKKLRWADWNRLEKMGSLIESAEADKARLEQTLADPELYRSRGSEVAGLRAELEHASAEIERLYAEWQDLESRRSA